MPFSVSSYVEHSKELLAQGQTELALQLLREAAQTHPNDPKAHYALGYALRDAGFNPEAIDAYRKAVDLWPDLECPRLILSFWLRDDGRVPEAIELYREGAKAFPHQRRLWFREMGRLYEASGDPTTAVALYDRVLAEFPGDELARMFRRIALEAERKRSRMRRPTQRRRQ